MRANRLGKRGDEELALVSEPSESDGSLSPRERDRRVPDVDERAARSRIKAGEGEGEGEEK